MIEVQAFYEVFANNSGSKSWAQIRTLTFNDCVILGELRNHEEPHFHTTVPRNRNSSLVGQQGGKMMFIV